MIWYSKKNRWQLLTEVEVASGGDHSEAALYGEVNIHHH